MVDYQYDPLQRLVSTIAPQWQEIAKYYDPAGNLLERQVADIQGTLDYHYTYDDLYQLTSETGFQPQTYQNDSLYNRISKNQQSYALNPLNQLLSETDRIYNYDANGNLVRMMNEEQITVYRYDALDRLIEVQQDDDLTRYRYDSFHRRVSKKRGDLTLFYIYQHDHEIGSANQNSILELRLLGVGQGAEIGAAVAIELQKQPYIPIHDRCGNVVTLLNFSGKVVANYRYTAFGEEQGSSISLNPWRFASKRFDPETGFIYFGRRYYLPSIGRWLTPDPL
jgi:YD repeat-containing protein